MGLKELPNVLDIRPVGLTLGKVAAFIALMLIAVLGKGVDKIIVALVTVQWAYYARTVRSAALVEKRKEYMEAARCLALPPSRIVFKHLLPNCLPPMIVRRAGPEMLHMLRGHMMGENKARFGSAIDEIVACARESPAFSQLQLI